MDLQSPLTQQARPEVFKPKIVGLYEELFQDEHFEQSEGFWRQLFLLPSDQTALQALLLCLSADDFLHRNLPTQDLFLQATEYVQHGQNPSDENALDTLTVFLEVVLNKKYPNPSSDIISVLTGLEDADAILSRFVGTLETAIRDGRTLDIRRKAVRATIATVAGAYQTGLVSYFVNRDLFPALLKLIQDADELFRLFAPCALLGLLVNYNKFEFQNPYQLRIEDYANDGVLRRTGDGMSHTFIDIRDAYLEIQEDAPDGWDLSSTLTWVGLGRLTNHTKPQQAQLSEDDIKVAFAAQPIPEAAILLSTYDFVNANKVFCFTFASPPPERPKEAAPFDSMLSFSSYVFQNAYRSARASLYSQMCLLVLRILIEDAAVMGCLTNGELLTKTHLCRQRQPLLPPVRSERTRVCIVLDVLVDGINHNLRKRLDVDLYVMFLEPMFRIFSYLSRSRLRLVYNWAEVWKSLLSFLKFLTSYSNDLKRLSGAEKLADRLASTLALALSTGEAFLPDEKSYDDLFYKIFESGELLSKFSDSYGISKRASAPSMEMLVSVWTHYQAMLEEKKGKSGKHISPREVSKLIKEGYDTLSIQSKEGMDQWVRYREADYRNLVKKVTRTAVQDMRTLLAERTA